MLTFDKPRKVRPGAGARVARWISGLCREVLAAARMLCRHPAFSMLAIGTLALGLGLATGMFAVIDGALWHPLPYRNPDRLVCVRGAISYPILLRWLESVHSFADIAGYRNKRYTLTGAGEAVSLRATVSSGSLFSVLEAHAARGRVLSHADDTSGLRPVLISDAAWRSVFEAAPEILGKTIYLNRVPFVVVGVMPAGFQFPANMDRIDLYTTVAADLQADSRQAEKSYPRDLQVVARLKPGLALAQAQAEMFTVASADEGQRARPNLERKGLVVPLAEEVSGSLVSPLRILAYAVACVLVIACVTVAILVLIRVHARRGELATRLALGATRGQIARQLIIECIWIAVSAAIVGGVFAVFLTRPLLLAAGPDLASVARIQFGFRTIAVLLLLSLAAAAGFGAIPAIQAAAARWPHFGSAGVTAGRRRKPAAVRLMLVTAEIALTVSLLAASISLLRAYLILSHVNPGFESADVLTFRIDLSDALYTPQQQVEFFDRVRAEAKALPGVQSAAFTALLPFGDLRFTIRLDVPGHGSGDGSPQGVEVHLVSPGFFRSMGIPLLNGRDFAAGDIQGKTRVGIISLDLAERCFPGENPIGRSIDAGFGPGSSTNPLVQIIGIAGNIRNGTLAAPADPQLYVPFSQSPMIASTTYVVRLSQADSGATLAAIRRRVREVNPAVPIVDSKPLADYVNASLLQPRFNTLLVGVFAAAAILLAMAGLYAVVSYSVLQRRREFSIRRALGATDRRIAWLVIRQGLLAIVPGIALGLGGALAANRLLASVLYGTRPNPPLTLLLASVIAATVSLSALWPPARAASGDDLRVTLQADA